MAPERTDLTEAVAQLIDAVLNGELLDLAGDGPATETAMRSWGPSRTIRATVIRDIVRGRLAAEPDPRGLRLRGARIDGRVDLDNVARDLEVQFIDCFLPDGLTLRRARLSALTLQGCAVAVPAHSDEVPVDATSFASRELSLSVTISCDSADGAVLLRDAHVGHLDLATTRLTNTGGPALVGDGLTVDQNLLLGDGFGASAISERGAIRLLLAHIGGAVQCVGATIENPAGPAFGGDGMQVGGMLLLGDGFRATAASALGVVRLVGAHIAGPFECRAVRLENTAGAALYADNLHVGQNLLLGEAFAATGSDRRGVILLRATHIGGVLSMHTAQVRNAGADERALVDIAGTTYSGPPHPGSVGDWLELIGRRTAGYDPQPYQQLAAVHRAAGHDHAVRAILMAQRRDQIRRRAVGGADRVWARTTGLTLGFGYQPWRALFLLLIVLAFSVGAAVTAGHRGGLAHTGNAPAPGAACSVTEQVGVGLDLGVPLLKTGARDHCAPTATAAGQALTVSGWVLQTLAWASAALFIAGFTGAVRKT